MLPLSVGAYGNGTPPSNRITEIWLFLLARVIWASEGIGTKKFHDAVSRRICSDETVVAEILQWFLIRNDNRKSALELHLYVEKFEFNDKDFLHLPTKYADFTGKRYVN